MGASFNAGVNADSTEGRREAKEKEARNHRRRGRR
jgi:hypothetical protein